MPKTSTMRMLNETWGSFDAHTNKQVAHLNKTSGVTLFKDYGESFDNSQKRLTMGHFKFASNNTTREASKTVINT